MRIVMAALLELLAGRADGLLEISFQLPSMIIRAVSKKDA